MPLTSANGFLHACLKFQTPNQLLQVSHVLALLLFWPHFRSPPPTLSSIRAGLLSPCYLKSFLPLFSWPRIFQCLTPLPILNLASMMGLSNVLWLLCLRKALRVWCYSLSSASCTSFIIIFDNFICHCFRSSHQNITSRKPEHDYCNYCWLVDV